MSSEVDTVVVAGIQAVLLSRFDVSGDDVLPRRIRTASKQRERVSF